MYPLAAIRDQRMARPKTTGPELATPQNTLAEQPTESPAGARRRESDVTSPELLQQIQQALSNLKFGNVTITVQDGVVVQIERIEKRRLR